MAAPRGLQKLVIQVKGAALGVADSLTPVLKVRSRGNCAMGGVSSEELA